MKRKYMFMLSLKNLARKGLNGAMQVIVIWGRQEPETYVVNKTADGLVS